MHTHPKIKNTDTRKRLVHESKPFTKSMPCPAISCPAFSVNPRWGLTDSELCACGDVQTISYIVDCCPLTRPEEVSSAYTQLMIKREPG